MTAIGCIASSSATAQEKGATTVSRSREASTAYTRTSGPQRCDWRPCGQTFVPRTTGGKRQKYCTTQCRELAKLASRATRCPHCGGSLRVRAALVERGDAGSR